MSKQIMKARKGIRKEKGQSYVELALTLTLLLTIAIGAFEFGKIFAIQAALENALQEGVHFASYYPDDETEIRKRIKGTLNAGFFVIENEVADGDIGIVNDGTNITISIQYQHDILTPIFSQTVMLNLDEQRVIISY